MVALGDEFFKGNSRPRNLELAAFWYRKAALQNLPLARYRYGVCLEFGWGVHRDLQSAFEQYSKASTLGIARLRMAEMIISGVPGSKKRPSLPPDRNKGLEIMRSLCREHYYPALMKLARVLYADPRSKKECAKEIYDLVLRSSNASPVPPEVNVFRARLLQEGVGTAPDPVLARALLELAAKEKNAEAEFMFAEALEFGRGTRINKTKAFEFYSRSARSRFPAAQVRMGDYHLEGTFLPHDPAESVRLYTEAAKNVHPPALRKLGWCSENGIGTPKDLRQAFNYYERSAELGDAEGIYHTGRCFRDGIGVKADPAGAVYFFRRSAALGHKEGTLALAECLRTGRGCTPDPELARRLLEAVSKH